MRKYSNKFNKIIISDTEEENPISSSNYPPYQIVHQRNFTNMSSYQDQGDYYSKKMQFSSPYNNILTEPSQQKVDFTSKNTAKSYMEKRAYTPSHITRNNYNFQESKNKNGYFSDFKEEYPPYGANNKDIVNIKRMYYKGSQTPEQNRGFISGDDYDFEFKKNENFLENYGYHESKNIKNKDDKKYEFVTYVNGYSNLVPINNSSSNTRIETYNNYNYRREQEFQPKLVNTVERVRELQRGKKEYDEFMRKLGEREYNDKNAEKYRIEKLREEKIKMEKIRQEKMKQERAKNEKIKQTKITIQQKNYKIDKNKTDKTKKNKIIQEKVKVKSNSKPKPFQKVVINTEASGKRNDVFKKEFRAHSGRYRYKDNINEEINQYRNKSTYSLEQKNIGRKETVYKNDKKKTSKSYNKLPIKTSVKVDTTKYTASSRNSSIQNNKNINQIKTNKTISKTSTSINNSKISQGKNSYRISNASNSSSKDNNNQPKKPVKSAVSTNVSKKSYTSKNISYNNQHQIQNNNIKINISKQDYHINKDNNNYRKDVVQKVQKTGNLNYSKGNNLIEAYEPNYDTNYEKREIEEQYLLNMEEPYYDNNRKYEIKEVSKKIYAPKQINLGDNYGFYESKHLRRPDNNSYTIHERYGESRILEKNYGKRKVRHYEVMPSEDTKYYTINNPNNFSNNIRSEYYRDNYNNYNYVLSPNDGEPEDEYENNVEEYNYVMNERNY